MLGILSHGSEAEGPRGDGRRPWSLSQEFDPLAGEGKPRKSWRRKKRASHCLAGRGEGFQIVEWARVAHLGTAGEGGGCVGILKSLQNKPQASSEFLSMVSLDPTPPGEGEGP